MKTFRFIGMALLAVAVGFTSCSNDNDPANDGSGSGKEKILTEVKATSGNRTMKYTFSYDKNGHLASAYDGDIYNYSWSNNSIIETEDDESITYHLENGLIKGGEEDDSDFDVAYNSSKQLIALNYYDSGSIDERDAFT